MVRGRGECRRIKHPEREGKEAKHCVANSSKIRFSFHIPFNSVREPMRIVVLLFLRFDVTACLPITYVYEALIITRVTSRRYLGCRALMPGCFQHSAAINSPMAPRYGRL